MSRTSKQKILIAAANSEAYSDVQHALEKVGFKVSVVTNTDTAIMRIAAESPDFILLDSGLSKNESGQLCNRLRMGHEISASRIIHIHDDPTAADKAMSQIGGADAYLLKPFEMDELLEKISALQHRRQTDQLQHILRAGTIEMIPAKWVVHVNGTPVDLTETEYRILQLLLEVEGRVLTREDLLERVWGHEKALTLESRTLDMHMSRLRHKLGNSAKNIITVRNVGYRVDVAASIH